MGFGSSFEEAYDNLGESYEVYPEPCECGKGTWRQVGYDPNYEGAELVEYECTGCGKLITIRGQERWLAGRA